MSQQKFFDFSKIIGEEMEVLLTRLKSLIGAKKITDNLPDDLQGEINGINYKIDAVNKIKDALISGFDGGTYEHVHIWGDWMASDEENCIRVCKYGDEETKLHIWDEGIVTTPATHIDYGEKMYVCNNCGFIKTEQISKLSEHTYGDWISIDKIYHQKSCACGAVVTEEHIWDEGVITVEPTTTSTGVMTYTCTNCEEIKTEEIPISFPEKDTLENMNWEDISTVSKAGKASEYWSVGDQKTINVNGVDYLFDIIGFDHDDVTDASAYGREKAGITFECRQVLDDGYPMHSTIDDLTVGWHNCDMRLISLPSLFETLDDSLKNVIVNVNKITGATVKNTSRATVTTEDTLFLLSYTEVCGEVSSAIYAGTDPTITVFEGNQYEYYANGGGIRKYKTDGTVGTYWLRTPDGSNNGFIFYSSDTAPHLSVHNNYLTDVIKGSFEFCV